MTFARSPSAWPETYGLEIFDVQFRREAVGWVLRVTIDRPGRGRHRGEAGVAGRRGRRRRLPPRQPAI